MFKVVLIAEASVEQSGQEVRIRIAITPLQSMRCRLIPVKIDKNIVGSSTHPNWTLMGFNLLAVHGTMPENRWLTQAKVKSDEISGLIEL